MSVEWVKSQLFVCTLATWSLLAAGYISYVSCHWSLSLTNFYFKRHFITWHWTRACALWAVLLLKSPGASVNLRVISLGLLRNGARPGGFLHRWQNWIKASEHTNEQDIQRERERPACDLAIHRWLFQLSSRGRIWSFCQFYHFWNENKPNAHCSRQGFVFTASPCPICNLKLVTVLAKHVPPCSWTRKWYQT